ALFWLICHCPHCHLTGQARLPCPALSCNQYCDFLLIEDRLERRGRDAFAHLLINERWHRHIDFALGDGLLFGEVLSGNHQMMLYPCIKQARTVVKEWKNECDFERYGNLDFWNFVFLSGFTQ